MSSPVSMNFVAFIRDGNIAAHDRAYIEAAGHFRNAVLLLDSHGVEEAAEVEEADE